MGNNPLRWVDPYGLFGIGIVGTAGGEVGVVESSAGGTYSAGVGVFGGGGHGITGGTYTSSGSFAVYPPIPITSEWGAGAYAGAGVGIFITNASSAEQLTATISTTSIDLGLISIQWSTGGGIWIVDVTGGLGLFVGGSTIDTGTSGATFVGGTEPSGGFGTADPFGDGGGGTAEGPGGIGPAGGGAGETGSGATRKK